MDYKMNIQSNVTKKSLTFNELTDVIVRLYGTSVDEDGKITMSSNEMESHLRNIFDNDSYTMALAVHNSSQLRNVLTWYYDVDKSDGYLQEKLSVTHILPLSIKPSLFKPFCPFASAVISKRHIKHSFFSI